MSKDQDIERDRVRGSYEDWLRQKVAVARLNVQAGRLASNEDVEIRFAALRTKVLTRKP